MLMTPTKSRVIIIATLALLSVLLGIFAVVFAPRTAAGRVTGGTAAGVAAPGEAEIRRGFEAVCADFRVPPSAMKMHSVKDRSGRTVRMEYRLVLPKDFSSLEFNQALGQKVAPWGARVVGTERTHERTVTLHVVREEMTMLSVILDMNEPMKAGKDHGN